MILLKYRKLLNHSFTLTYPVSRLPLTRERNIYPNHVFLMTILGVKG